MAKAAVKNDTQILSPQQISDLVDKLGLLKAVLAPQLEELDKGLDILKALGAHVYEGKLYEVNVFDQERSTLDMKAVREKLSQQFITAHTSTKTVRIAKVTGRKVA